MTPERKAKFDSLVASVKEKGIIQPIVVRPIATEGGEVRYEIMAGERRFRACREVAAERGSIESATIPAMVRVVDDQTAIDIMTIENLQKEDLSPVEKAESFRTILAQNGGSIDTLKDLSKRFGIASHAIRLQVALLDLPKPVLDAWDGGKITTAHVEQFTRLVDERAILEALTECLRQRLTVNELSDLIAAQKPPMKTAKFDTEECAVCVSNSALQGDLFTGRTDDGVCLNPGCFKAKQGAFFTGNWEQSKAKEILGTNAFRFKDDLTAADYQIIRAETPEARCQECPEFASIVTVTGSVVKGQERVCVGARRCFDELYAKPAPTAAPKAEKAEKGAKSSLSKPAAKATVGKGEASDPEKGAEPEEGAGCGEASSQDDEKRALRRGETFRENFYKEALTAKMASLPPNQPASVRLYIIALALESSSARTALCKRLGVSEMVPKKEILVTNVFSRPAEELLPTLLDMALHPIMDQASFQAVSSPQIRDLVAHNLGIDLRQEWVITKEYLDSMTKAEIVRMGEEEGVGFWKDEKVKAYKEQHHPKKGWMSLKKSELMDCILKSEADLAGKVPSEIHSKGRAV